MIRYSTTIMYLACHWTIHLTICRQYTKDHKDTASLSDNYRGATPSTLYIFG